MSVEITSDIIALTNILQNSGGVWDYLQVMNMCINATATCADSYIYVVKFISHVFFVFAFRWFIFIFIYF